MLPKSSSLVFALTLSLGAMLASAGPVAKAAAPAKPAAAAPAAAPAAGGPASAATAPGEATASTIVYLAKAGSRYHTKDCRYLKNGKGKEITIGDAMKQGYAPCNICKAPRLKR